MSDYCVESDQKLARFTILRYLVLGGIISYRVWAKKGKSSGPVEWIRDFVRAGWEFAMSEGVGLVIYFVVSALMDNLAIFFERDAAYCSYVKMAALYTMALVTFLPVCWFAYAFQGRLYDGGKLLSQLLFLFCMVVITMASFVLRLGLVFRLGWAEITQELLDRLGEHLKIIVAVMVPPVVDGVQSALLIMSSYLASLYSGADKSSGAEASGLPQTSPEEKLRSSSYTAITQGIP
mmetsp:Transcript_7590/g.9818  ORF Transcript_7590/g.9818 Transcript_7590/m.9818 type:complete len:235 (-) Transcript_7590:45-749(-)